MQKTTFKSMLLTAVLAVEPNPPQWDTNRVKIFSPTDSDCQSIIDTIFFEQGGYNGPGEWSEDRYALMFKPGQHACNVNVGYYTSVIGLGNLPTDTTLANIYASDHCDTSNPPVCAATANFWRSIDNITFGYE